MVHRAVLHVDMDAFFVSVELRNRPELVGKPVIVGFPEGRSVVLSASYDCRARGIHSAMPMSQAIPLMPEATIIEPSHHLYAQASGEIMAYFRTLTPLVEQVSVDEAFLDVTGSMRMLGGPMEIGRTIREHIRKNMGLPASVGIAKNKFIAKLASTYAKPDGMAVIAPDRTEEFLEDLPVSKMWGVGKRTGQQLHALGIETVGQLSREPEERLIVRMGEHGRSLHRLANGIDDRPVEVTRDEKSISAEHTFAVDVSEVRVLEDELLRLSHRVAKRLRDHGKSAGGVGLKIKYRDFTGLTRSRALGAATDSSATVGEAGMLLLKKLLPLTQPVRLIGIRAERLEDSAAGLQLSLDPKDEKVRDAERVADLIGQKFPQSLVTPARFLRPRE